MGTFNQLYRSSFKGVNFLTEGQVRTSGGRKLIDHIYPNSERRFIEDIGKLQDDIVITGIIKGPNYFAKRNQLKSALESAGAGRLSHPFLGSINVVARPYTLIEDMGEINVARFEMSFGKPSENVFPKQKGFSFNQYSTNLLDSLNADFINEWTTSFSSNLLTAENALNQVYNQFDDIARTFASASDALSTFKNLISDSKNKISSLIRNASDLASNIGSLFSSANELSVGDALNAFEIFKSAFSSEFGDRTRLSIPENKRTEIINEEINNFKALDVLFNGQALTYAYLNASLINYSNDEQLFETNQLIEDQYNFLIEDINNDTVAENIYQIRDEFRKFSDDAQIEVDKIIEINTKPTSLVVLCNSYYGETDNYESLLELNDVINPAEVSDNFKVLSE